MTSFFRRFLIGLAIGIFAGLLVFYVPGQVSQMKYDPISWDVIEEPTLATEQIPFGSFNDTTITHYPLTAQVSALVDLLTAAHNRANQARLEVKIAQDSIQELLEVIMAQEAYIQRLRDQMAAEGLEEDQPTPAPLFSA
ncbi:MAG: hypothetical protein ACYSWO_26595 [Planctomycetota bacterium]|jgi:hypothetical protein